MINYKKLVYIAFMCVLGTANLSAGKEEAPLTVEGAETIDAAKALELFNGGSAMLLDTRKVATWEGNTIPGSVNLDVKADNFEELYSEASLATALGADKSKVIIVFCNGEKCDRSAKAAALLVKAGYTNVKYLRVGFPGWQTAGGPTTG